MRNMLQSESEAVVGRLQPRCAVDEDDRIIAKMVLTVFGKPISASACFFVE